MTRADIIAAMRAIEQRLNNGTEVWRVIIDAKGNELQRIYRGSFNAHQHQEETK